MLPSPPVRRNRICGLIKALIACGCQLQQTVVLLRCKVVVKEIYRVNRCTIFVHFVVAVRTGAFAGATHPANYLPAFYLLPYACLNAHHVSVQRFVAITVINNYMVAIAAFVETGTLYRTSSSCIYRCADGRSKIKAGVQFGYFIHR